MKNTKFSNLSKFFAVFLFGFSACVITACNSNNPKPTECDPHNGFHYDYKNPTKTESGCKEFWICNECENVFLDEPTKGEWENKGVFTGNLSENDARYIPVVDADKIIVEFDGNGGKLESGSTYQIVSDKSEIVAPTFTRLGYEFTGWDVDLSTIVSDTLVTAQWNKLATEDGVKNLSVVTVDGQPLIYETGELFNKDDVIVTATYENDIKLPVVDYDYRPSGPLQPTDKAIEFAFGKQICSIPVQVNRPEFDGDGIRIEAENTVLSGKFNSGEYKGRAFNENVIKADHNTIGIASNDRAIWNFSTVGNTISMSFTSTEATIVDLSVGVAKRSGDVANFDDWFTCTLNDEPFLLNQTVDGSDAVGSWTFTTVSTTISAKQGANTLTLTVKTNVGNLDYFDLVPTKGTLVDTTVPTFTLEPGEVKGAPLLIEAEDCALKGKSSKDSSTVSETNIVTKDIASGGKCLNYMATKDNWVSFNVYSDVEEEVKLTIRCASRKGTTESFDKWFTCTLNSTQFTTNTSMPSASDYYTFHDVNVNVTLLRGLNNFRLAVAQSGSIGNLDAFTITPVNAALRSYTYQYFRA